MSPVTDLTLPAYAPKLGKYADYHWNDAAFALYSLVDISEAQIGDVASELEREWLEDEMETHLVLPAKPTASFAGKTLKDVVQAHVAMDMGIRKNKDRDSRGDLSWRPTSFMVIVKKEWKSRGGLLFVFVDDEQERCPLDKFFLRPEDAHLLLSSLVFGDEWLADVKDQYAADEDETED
ncbi:hypothetical protein F5Y13DRAFT_203130 [Hypoxylon sp. FL1857]|nr:hypothetical protein F5Y13DRAFT_203130 [Hypoxylon sp. FL1857]